MKVVEYLSSEDEDVKAIGRQILEEWERENNYKAFDNAYREFKAELTKGGLKTCVVDCFFFTNFRMEQKRFYGKKPI